MYEQREMRRGEETGGERERRRGEEEMYMVYDRMDVYVVRVLKIEMIAVRPVLES